MRNATRKAIDSQRQQRKISTLPHKRNSLQAFNAWRATSTATAGGGARVSRLSPHVLVTTQAGKIPEARKPRLERRRPLAYCTGRGQAVWRSARHARAIQGPMPCRKIGACDETRALHFCTDSPHSSPCPAARSGTRCFALAAPFSCGRWQLRRTRHKALSAWELGRVASQ